MKNTTLLLVFLLGHFYSIAQPINKISIAESTFNIGTNFFAEEQFPTKEFSFTKMDVMDFRFYPELDYMVVHAGFVNGIGDRRLKSSVFGYDLNARGISWNFSVSILDEVIHLKNDQIIHNKSNETLFHNVKTGNPSTFIRDRGYAFDHPQSNHAIFYDSKYGYKDGSAYIHSLDTYLPIGRKVTVPVKYGIREVVNLGDSAIIVSSEGLHYVNFENGDTWSIHKSSGYKDAGSTILKGLAGIALGLATGVYVIPIAADVVYGVSSNVILEDGHIFYCSRNSLIKADLQGNIIWELENVGLGRSTLISYHDRLVLIDQGFAFKNNSTIKVSVPQVLAMDKADGRNMTFANLKHGHIYDVEVSDEKVFLLQKNTIAVFDLHENSLLDYLHFPQNMISDDSWTFESNTYFEWNEGVMRPLSDAYDLSFVIQSAEKDDVFVCDEKMQILSLKKKHNLYAYITDLEDLKVFQSDGHVIFANDEYAVIA